MKSYKCDGKNCTKEVTDTLPSDWYCIKVYLNGKDHMHRGMFKINTFYYCPDCGLKKSREMYEDSTSKTSIPLTYMPNSQTFTYPCEYTQVTCENRPKE